MNPKIIAERDNSLILFEAGKVKTVPNTLYNQVKYRDYKGERIFYTFSDGVYVKETFDDGIFNAFMNEETIQIRDSIGIAEAIRRTTKTNHLKIFSRSYTLLKERQNLWQR